MTIKKLRNLSTLSFFSLLLLNSLYFTWGPGCWHLYPIQLSSNLRQARLFTSWLVWFGRDTAWRLHVRDHEGKRWRYRHWRFEPVLRIWIRIQIRQIRMFLGLLDPDPSIIKQQYVVRTALILIVWWLFFDLLSLKNYVNVPSKSIKQKNKI